MISHFYLHHRVAFYLSVAAIAILGTFAIERISFLIAACIVGREKP
jgi:hypothetical protein